MRLVFATAAVLCASSAYGEIIPYFAPSKQIPALITKTLDDAEHRIDLAMYSLTDTTAVKKLCAASKRGVTVRVILHDARKSPQAPKLEEAGCDVRYVTNVMHHKFVIADGTLLTGSCNWSRSAYSRYDEDVVKFVNEPQFVQAFQREFESIWGHSRDFGEAIHPDTEKVEKSKALALFTSANLTKSSYRGEPSYRSGKDLAAGVCGERIIESINQARKSIQIATTHFRRGDIADALNVAMKRGVKVQMLLDAQEYHSSRTKIPSARFDEELASQGAEVRYKFYSPYWDYKTALQMHCKFMVVDESEVLTGSLNWSENSELRTFENLVVLTDKKVVAKYASRHAMMWKYGQGQFADLIAGEKRSNFPPISLVGEQVAELRRAFGRRR